MNYTWGKGVSNRILIVIIRRGESLVAFQADWAGFPVLCATAPSLLPAYPSFGKHSQPRPCQTFPGELDAYCLGLRAWACHPHSRMTVSYSGQQ